MRLEGFYYLLAYRESNTEAQVCVPSVPLRTSCTIERTANSFPFFAHALSLFLSLSKALWTIFQSIAAAP